MCSMLPIDILPLNMVIFWLHLYFRNVHFERLSVCICVYSWVWVCVYVCAWNLCYRVYVCEDKHFTKVHSSTTLSYTYVRKELCNEQLIYDDCSTKHFDLHPWHVVQGNLAETRNTGTTHNNTFTTPTIISRSQNHKRSRFAVDPQLHYVHAIILPYHQKRVLITCDMPIK